MGIFGMGGTLSVAMGPVMVLVVLSRTGTEFAPWFMLPGIVAGLLTLYVVPEQEEGKRPVVRPRFRSGGLLALAATLGSLVSVRFIGAMPLWLVQARGLEHEAALIRWTLASFSLAAGALVHAGAPVLVVSAQDMAPQAVATASGMLMGFVAGTAGLLYTGVGHLQEVIGLGPAMRFTFLLPIPSALLALYLLGKAKRSPLPEKATAEEARALCLCAPCLVGGVATDLPIQAR